MSSDYNDLVLSRLSDLLKKADKTKRPCASCFYAPTDLCDIQKINVPLGVTYKLWGGHLFAERKVLTAYPDFLDFDDDDLNDASDITVLHITNTARKSLSHRDFLGALMSMGIERDRIGDILICDDEAVVFICSSIVDYIEQNIEKVGNCRINIERLTSIDPDFLKNFLPKKESRVVIIPSMRLDCVIADVYSLSRSEAQRLIKAESVRVNYRTCPNSDKSLLNGDLVSVSGKGRFEISDIEGNTKKGNIRLGVLIYI